MTLWSVTPVFIANAGGTHTVKGKSKKKITSSDAEHVIGLSLNQARVNAIKGAQGREDYEAQLHLLQVELVKPQQHFVGCGDRVFVLLKGWDAAGKDGSIERITEFLSPRETKVVALGKPPDRERTGWYFQRYMPHLPLAGESILFSRSWYSRVGVRSVMGLCTAEQYGEFMHSVPHFEEMLINSGIELLKHHLGTSRAG